MMKFKVCGRFATGSCRCWDEKGINRVSNAGLD